MIKSAKEFLRECQKDKAFKKSVDAIDDQHMIDFAEAYAELRLSDVLGRSEQFKCDCGGTNHYKNEIHDSVMCADCGTVYAISKLPCDHPEDEQTWMRSGKSSYCNKCNEMVKAKDNE